MSSTNIQIAVKARPLIERELKDKVDPLWVVRENGIVQLDGSQNFIGESYSFDHIFDQYKTNENVYSTVVKPLVLSCLEGINSTIFAYGQTSSGKTHTMLGDKNTPGIINFTVQDVFKHIEENTTKNFLLRCSYLEIYNEKINDLLNTSAKDLKIREDFQGVHVAVKEEVVRESEELFVLMKKGMKTRKIGCTDMNERSSRSHTIFKLIIQSQNKDSEGSYTESSLSLVDLAGSERVGQMNIKGERHNEGVSINKSLTTLGLVIRRLSDNEQYINYRDSKLTRLLQHSLGGNSKTLIICTITVVASEETKSTLEFAQRAKYVKNQPIINERVTDKDQLKQYANLCQHYKEQLEKLRYQNVEREKTINALEGKILNIKLFSSSGDPGKEVKVSRIPQRRHTLGHYKLSLKVPFLTPDLDSGASDENSDEETSENKAESPIKDDVLRATTDNEEDYNFNNEMVSSTNHQKTPSPILRARQQLLEESYESLKTFTNMEKQITGSSSEIIELRELSDCLRNENISLKQQTIRARQTMVAFIDKNKELLDQLMLVKSILEGRSLQDVRRQSLHTITEEEDIECLSDVSDPTSYFDSIEHERIKEFQVADEKCTALLEENQALKKDLEQKSDALTNLKNCISREKETKEVELMFLNDKIKKMGDYREQLHQKISELMQGSDHFESVQNENKQLKENLKQTDDKIKQHQNDAEVLKIKNNELTQELEIRKKDFEELKQLVENSSLKIEELEENNAALKASLEKTKQLANKMELLKADNSYLKQEVELKSQKVMDQVVELESLKDKNEELKKNMKSTLSDFEKVQQECGELKQLVDSVKEEQGALKEQLFDKEKRIEQLKSQIIVLETLKCDQKYDDLLNNLEIVILEKNNLENKNSELKKEVEQVGKDNICALKDLELVKSEKQELQKVNDKLKGQITSLELVETNLKRQLHDLTNDNIAWLKKYDEVKESSENANSDFKKKLEVVILEKNDLDRVNNGFKTEIDKLAKQANGAMKDLELAMLEKGELQKMIDKAKGRISTLELVETDLRRHINNLTNENTAWQKKYDDGRGSFENANTDFQKQLEMVMLEKNDLERVNSELKTEVGQLAKQTSCAAKDLELVMLEKEELQRINDRVKCQTTTLELVEADLKRQIHDLTNEKKDCQKKYDELKDSFENSKSDFRKQLEIVMLEKNDHERVNNDLKKEVEQVANRANGVIKELGIVKSENEELQKFNDRLLKENEQKCQEIVKIQDLFNSYEKEGIAELNLHIARLESLQTDLQKEIVEVRQSLTNCSLELELTNLEKADLRSVNKNLREEIDLKSREIEAARVELNKENDQCNNFSILIKDLKEEIERVKKENDKIVKEKGELEKVNLANLKQFDSQDKEYAILKEKYRTQEIQLNDLQKKIIEECKNSNQLRDVLENNIIKISEVERLENENEELRSKLQDGNRPTEQQYKAKLEKIEKVYSGNIAYLNKSVARLTEDNKELEKRLSKSEAKVTLLETEVKRRTDMYDNENKSLKDKLNRTESELEMEKNRVYSFSQKLEKSEAEVESLQAKVTELTQCKSNSLEKNLGSPKVSELISKTRLSFEGKPLSTNDIRKIKRQSIHDQRRGLLVDTSDSMDSDNLGCSDCQELNAKLKRVRQKNRDILREMEDLKNRNDFLEKENKNIPEKAKGIEGTVKEITDRFQECNKENVLVCNDCKDWRTKIIKFSEERKNLLQETENLKKENRDLDRENDDMLKIIEEMRRDEKEFHAQIDKLTESLKKSEYNPNLSETCRLQCRVEELSARNTELTKEVSENKKLIKEYKDKLADVESNYLVTEYKHGKIEKELQNKIADFQCKLRKPVPQFENKETQATCDMFLKYKQVRRIAVLRREEGNFLRAKLNLPPDCPVLPEDIAQNP